MPVGGENKSSLLHGLAMGSPSRSFTALVFQFWCLAFLVCDLRPQRLRSGLSSLVYYSVLSRVVLWGILGLPFVWGCGWLCVGYVFTVPWVLGKGLNLWFVGFGWYLAYGVSLRITKQIKVSARYSCKHNTKSILDIKILFNIYNEKYLNLVKYHYS